ncbi:MAG TPA: FAD-dependent oxidoreductase, partial [Pseudonocardiaceae bacterium]
EALDVDAVVLAVTAPAARELLAEVALAASAGFGQIRLASTAIVAVALPSDVSLPESSGVLIGSGEKHADGTPFTAKAFTYCSRKWPHIHTPEQVFVRGSVGKYGEDEILRRDDADLVRLVLSDLAELTGVTAKPIDAVVQRWTGGLPQYGVGHLDLVAGIDRAVAELPGLAVVGNALNGVGLPACVNTASAAATRIAEPLRDRVAQRR